MIEYRYGCVASALKIGEVGCIAHQANCFNVMGSGVAKAIRQLYPEAHAADLKTVKGDRKKLGGFSVARTLDGNVYNLYGQYAYGRDPFVQYTNYADLRSALTNMAHHLRHAGFEGKIGIPKLGCGLGGGDWEEVELIVSQALHEWGVIVYEL